ncbi:hypothetical protein K450DRAFT_245393 [Umbelopsis ramanniana AG]|uniref:Histone chaperone RTT106/FACT complex subunit SPT16-like middle domain-containing protein n=1 Tax=Umbelopsis ramanniana AG TaxID=1314678 RepID=A0AAD5E7E2_UMBRA|nr:uncharacterized protein K450DRAFT_245393 [Umbelopsis ramanniana AG]KAI8578766.1 hypothetical protein K450DRAFT_245393 [Umbelopsis ramanniana AG]
MTTLSHHIDDQTLRNDLEQLVANDPKSKQVIDRLITYFLTRSGAQDEESKNAKRSLDESDGLELVKSNPTYKLKEISFTAPERKKMDLLVGERHLLIQHYKSQYELAIPIERLDTLVCVPTPEKAKPVYTFILFEKNPRTNAIVFSLPGHDAVSFYDMKADSSNPKGLYKTDDLCSFFENQIKIPRILRPSAEAFVYIKLSPLGQRQENFGVKAYRKTSEGYLFFLPNGIFYGFKKPCLLFPLSDIGTTSFHDITQRTFNLTLTMKVGHQPRGVGYDALVNKNKDPSVDSAEGDSYEFSMIDQTEYGVIDQYIKKNKINDNSMSEERKAPPPKLQQDEMDDEDEEETETAKKRQPADDDDDDEEDVNFQPSDNSDDEDLEYDSQASDQEGANGSDDEEVEGDNNEDNDADDHISGDEAPSTRGNAMDEDEEDELDE